jgi:hypothetical protein
MAPELFSGVHVGKMHFDHWQADGSNRVAKGYGGMSVASRIENDTMRPFTCLVQGIDQPPFAIRLKSAHFRPISLPESIRRWLIFQAAPVNLGSLTQ